MKIREIPIEQFEKDLNKLESWMPHYKAIKKEFENRGNWKPKPRGIGFQKGEDPRRSKIIHAHQEQTKKIVSGNLFNEQR